MHKNPDITVIIPFYNEVESLPELYDWIKRVLKENQLRYELLFIDDGSTDQSWRVIEGLISREPFIRGIRFRRNFGKSAALHVGFKESRGNVVITMDADLQDSPDEIPALYRMIVGEDYDLVSGWKKKRFDPIGKTLPSKFFNLTARWVSGIKLHDFNCGLKAYKREVIKNIEIYGEMHRYIPIIAQSSGFRKITEKAVEHHPRKYGESKFGVERMIKGFLDLLSLKFITKFSKRPMHLFGSLGTLMFVSGGFLTIYVIADKLYKQFNDLPLRSVTDQPLFFLSLLFVILGVQLFLAGFLGELISRNSSSSNDYAIRSMVESQIRDRDNQQRFDSRSKPNQHPDRNKRTPQEQKQENISQQAERNKRTAQDQKPINPGVKLSNSTDGDQKKVSLNQNKIVSSLPDEKKSFVSEKDIPASDNPEKNQVRKVRKYRPRPKPNQNKTE